MKVLHCVLVTVIIMFALLVAACGGSTTTTPAATTPASTTPATTSINPITTTTTAASPTIAEKDKYGGIWRIVQTAGPSSPIGYVPESANDAMSAASFVLEAMFKVQRDGKIVPELATSWDVDSQAKTITFHLRKNVKFTDGSDFKAQNVKWCWDLAAEAKRTPNIASVDVLDDHTVRVNLKNYLNTDVTSFDGGYYSIFSKASFDKNGIDYSRNNVIGTGPFLLKEHVRGSKLVYVRNPNYWNPALPYLDGVEINIVAEETVRKMLFEKGDIAMLNVSSQAAAELIKKNYIYESEGGGTYGLVPDSANADSPYANIKVRQAISYAIDRDAIAEGLGSGIMKPAYQMYQGNPISALPEGQYLKTEYNPAKAKQLLAEAGYANGFKTTIHTFTQTVNRDFITAIAKMLGDVGIQCDADFPEAGKYQEYRSKGWKNAMLAHGFAALPALLTNPNGFATWYLPQNNMTFPSLKRPDGYYEALNASLQTPTVDPVKVKAAYKIMADDFTFICYAEDRVNTFYQKGVHDEGGKIYSRSFFYPEMAWLEASVRK